MLAAIILHDPWRELALGRLLATSALRLSIAQAEWSWRESAFHFSDIAGGLDPGRSWSAQGVVVGISPLDLWRLQLTRLVIINPRIQWQKAVEQKEDGAQTAAPAFLVNSLEMTDGSLLWHAADGTPYHLENIDISGAGLGVGRGELTFSAVSQPGGPMRGHLVMGEEYRLRLALEKSAAAPLLGMAGVAASAGSLDATLDATLTRDGRLQADVRANVRQWVLASGWRLDGRIDLVSDGDGLRMESQLEVTPQGVNKPSPVGISLAADVRENRWFLSRLAVSGGAEENLLRGSGWITPEPDLTLDLLLQNPLEDLVSLGGQAPEGYVFSLPQGITAQVQVSGAWAAPRLAWQALLREVAVQADAWQVEGLHITAQGDGGGQAFSPRITGGAKTVTWSGLSLSQVDFAAPLQTTEKGWSLPETALSFLLTEEKKTIPISWRGQVAREEERLHVQGPLQWGQSRADLSFTQQGASRLVLEIADQHPLLVPQHLPSAWLPKNAPAGSLAGRFTLDGENGEWKGGWSAAAKGWSLAVPSEKPGGNEALLQGLSGRVHGHLAMGKEGLSSISGTAAFAEGEWLVGTYYGDLRPEQPALQWHYQPRKGVWRLQGSVKSRTLPALTYDLAPWDGGWRGRLTLSGLDLDTLFTTYLKDSWATADSAWSQGAMGGKVAADLAFRVSGRPGVPPKLGGRFSVEKGQFTGAGAGWTIDGLDLDLPISQGKAGTLSIAAMTLGKVTMGSLSAQPAWNDDTLTITGKVESSLLGGRLELAGIVLDKIWWPQRQLTLSAAITGVQAEQIGQLLESRSSIRGEITARYDDVRYASGSLSTRGELNARVFGGGIRLRNLHAEGLDSPLPVWGMDVDIETLDLERLTNTVDVGMIQGTLSGEVKGLQLAGGEPVAFTAHVATVDGDAPQKINVKAIKNLQVLGSGGMAAIFERGIFSLFEDYRYRRLGFQCRLRNDTFHLAGVEEVDGRSYLVMGSLLPPRVDVVSHNQVIGWKDMVNRLKAMERSSREGSPEVR